MKISFSTTSFPTLDFQTAADLASRCGYDGVELAAKRDGNSSANALLTADTKIREAFTTAGVDIAALHVGSDLNELAERIELAHQLNCPTLILTADSIFGRTETVSPPMIDQLLTAGDTAAMAGIMLLIENQPIVGSAVRLWHLLDRLNHPAIGCCWNTQSAAYAKDSPTVAVPTLNSRIHAVVMQDAKWDSHLLKRCELGSGDLPVRKTIDRLRGIGFQGSLRVGFSDATNMDPMNIESMLAAARMTLQQWKILSTPLAASRIKPV